MRIVHAADLHLDSPLRGLQRYEGAPVERIRGATRRALSNLVDLCIEQEVALLLFAGDLFDGDWKDYSTGLFFAAQMSRLRAAGVQVVIVRGNHDAASHITRHLSLPDNVQELSSRAPETLRFESLGVAVHGQSFARRAETDDLASRYPPAVAGLLNIGLLHSSVTGRAGHENYAPCSLDVLRSKGYDYWALGHVHQREVLCEAPWVVFSGNMQGRHARELGDKGVTVIDVEGGGIRSVQHRAIDVVRWARCEVELADVERADLVPDRVRDALSEAFSAADGRALVARVVLEGCSQAHAELHAERERWVNEIRAVAFDVDPSVWVEKVQLRTTAPQSDSQRQARADALGELMAGLHVLRDDEDALQALESDFADLRSRLPPELRQGADGLRFEEAELWRELVTDVEELLLLRLLGGAEGA